MYMERYSVIFLSGTEGGEVLYAPPFVLWKLMDGARLTTMTSCFHISKNCF